MGLWAGSSQDCSSTNLSRAGIFHSRSCRIRVFAQGEVLQQLLLAEVHPQVLRHGATPGAVRTANHTVPSYDVPLYVDAYGMRP